MMRLSIIIKYELDDAGAPAVLGVTQYLTWGRFSSINIFHILAYVKLAFCFYFRKQGVEGSSGVDSECKICTVSSWAPVAGRERA